MNFIKVSPKRFGVSFLLSSFNFSETLVDDTYDGSAMEALDQNLIPFPYKVAKCLDPCTYRNIEYDGQVYHMFFFEFYHFFSGNLISFFFLLSSKMSM